MIKPDFDEWAERVWAEEKAGTCMKIREALEQAFNQGYHLGLREGQERAWREYADRKSK